MIVSFLRHRLAAGLVLVCALAVIATLSVAAADSTPFDVAVVTRIQALGAAAGLDGSNPPKLSQMERDVETVARAFVSLSTMIKPPNTEAKIFEMVQSKDYAERVEALADIVARQPTSCYAVCVLLNTAAYKLEPSWNYASLCMDTVWKQLETPGEERTKEGDLAIRGFLKHAQIQLVAVVMAVDWEKGVANNTIASTDLRYPSVKRRPDEFLGRDDVLACGQMIHLALTSSAFAKEPHLGTVPDQTRTATRNLALFGIEESEWKGVGKLVPALVEAASREGKADRATRTR